MRLRPVQSAQQCLTSKPSFAEKREFNSLQVWDPFAQVRFLATRLLFIAFWATGGMSSPYRARTPGRYRSSPATYLEEETSFRGLDLINFGVEGFLEPFDVDRALAYLVIWSCAQTA